ncbi:hypothetical protein P692DRAFT_20919169, partial [Suillus brevipes Sb2]
LIWSIVVISHVDSGKSTTTGHLCIIKTFGKGAAELGRVLNMVSECNRPYCLACLFPLKSLMRVLRFLGFVSLTSVDTLWKFETPKYMVTV